MKNRRVKYGYAYQNGVITVNPTESTTVKRIFDLYLNGLSLIKIVQLLIAEMLNIWSVKYRGTKEKSSE